MVMAEWLRPFGLFRLEKKMNKKNSPDRDSSI